MIFKNSLFLSEFKAQFNAWNLGMVVLMMLMSIVAVSNGITEFKYKLTRAETFKHIETLNLNEQNGDTDDSHIGHKVLFLPPASGVLSPTPYFIMELTARINATAALEISDNAELTSLFKRSGAVDFRFTKIILYAAVLFSLLLGHTAVRQRTYHKFLSAGAARSRVYLTLIFSRFVFLAAAFLLIYFTAYLHAFVRGIDISVIFWPAAFGQFGVTLLTALFFLVTGTITGSARNELKAYLFMAMVVAAAIAWHLIIVDDVISIKTDALPSQPPRLTEMETGFQDRRADAAGHYSLPAIFFPTSFYQLTDEAAGGKGYQGYLVFYDYLITLQRRLAESRLQRTDDNGPKQPAGVLTGNDMIFRSRGRLPRYFLPGLGITLGYILVLPVFGYSQFKRSMPEFRNNEHRIGGKPLPLASGKINSIEIKNRDFTERLLAVLYGSAGDYNGRLTLDGESLLTGKRRDFLYLPDLRELPKSMKVRQLLGAFRCLYRPADDAYAFLVKMVGPDNLNKTMGKLKPVESMHILRLLAETNPGGMVFFDDVNASLAKEEWSAIPDLLYKLRERGDTVIYAYSGEKPLMEEDVILQVMEKNSEYIVKGGNFNEPPKKEANTKN